MRQLGLEFVVPDFLVHIPGDMQGNHAIIEVKSAEAAPSGIAKELEILARFCNVVGYDRAIYLFYGGVRMEQVMRGVERGSPEVPLMPKDLGAGKDGGCLKAKTLGCPQGQKVLLTPSIASNPETTIAKRDL